MTEVTDKFNDRDTIKTNDKENRENQIIGTEKQQIRANTFEPGYSAKDPNQRNEAFSFQVASNFNSKNAYKVDIIFEIKLIIIFIKYARNKHW